MAKIEINIDESVLKEAEEALYSIGMDVQIAINVFLRRVAIDKGLPMSMTASISRSKEYNVSENSQVQLNKEYTHQTRNNTITREMVDGLWNAFIRYNKGIGEIRSLSDDVSKDTGMNRGSAFIYLTILSNLIKGESNTRTLKYKDLEYLMGKIESQLDESSYQNAIQSIERSIPYWKEKIPGAFADKVENFLQEHYQNPKRV